MQYHFIFKHQIDSVYNTSTILRNETLTELFYIRNSRKSSLKILKDFELSKTSQIIDNIFCLSSSRNNSILLKAILSHLSKFSVLCVILESFNIYIFNFRRSQINSMFESLTCLKLRFVLNELNFFIRRNCNYTVK